MSEDLGRQALHRSAFSIVSDSRKHIPQFEKKKEKNDFKTTSDVQEVE